MQKMSNDDGFYSLSALVFVLMLAFAIWLLSSCSSHHYFSINAEEITNPQIEYHDSLNVTNPF